MKAGAAALAAGILGGTGVLLFLLAFGTDYWLLATDTCGLLQHGNSTLSTGGVSSQTLCFERTYLNHFRSEMLKSVIMFMLGESDLLM